MRQVFINQMNSNESDYEETKQISTPQSNSELRSKPVKAQKKSQKQEQPTEEDDLGLPLTENLELPEMRLKTRMTPALRNSFGSHDGSFVNANNQTDSRGHQERPNSQKRSGNLKELLQRLPTGDRANSKEPQKERIQPRIKRSVTTKPTTEELQRLTVANSMKSAVTEKHTQSRLDNNSLKHAFAAFQGEFENQVDLYYKSYNRYIQETKSKMDVYVKATKKEKQNQKIFLQNEETEFWKDFPRKKKFYSSNLQQIKEIFDKPGSSQRAVSQVEEVRDVDEILRAILDYLPFSSRKYCLQFDLEPCTFFTADMHRTTATFDSLTNSLRMFDTENVRNWQILGFLVTILASDTIALILERRPGQNLPIQVSPEMTEVLIDYCKKFAQNKMLVQTSAGEDEDDLTIVDLLFDQVQFIWANQIYPKLSMLSRRHFDACLKMIQLPLQTNFSRATEQKVQEATQEVFFCRYLVIVPTDIKTGDKVLNLLERFLLILTTKSANDLEESFKHGVLATLKYLVENLCFYDVSQSSKTKTHIVPGKGLPFEPQAMQMLENRVNKIYQATEHLAKKESLREYAHYLMATILKIETESFVEQHLSSFMAQIKFSQFFQSKKTYANELKLINQLYYSGAVHLQKYKSWKPKVFDKSILLVDDVQQSVLLPVSKSVAANDSLALCRRLIMPTFQQTELPLGLSQPNEQPRPIIQSVSELFRLVFNPKLVHLFNDGCLVDFSHWQFLEQACFDDFEFISKSGIEFLLEQRYSDKHTQLLNLALKLAHFVLDPTSSFSERYLQMHGGHSTYRGQRFENQQKTMRKVVCAAILDILQTQLKSGEQTLERAESLQIIGKVNGGFRKCLDFFKLSDLKTLCNDQQQVIWLRLNNENCFIKPAAISKELKKQKLGKFHLQDQQRLISFEDLNEIEKQDFKYSDAYLNQLNSELAKTVGQATIDEPSFSIKTQTWDKKKEQFIRHRLCCYVSEVDLLTSNSSPTTSFVTGSGAASSKKDQPMQRQNTNHYNKINPRMHESLKTLKRILKMVHYLPELHEFFCASPLRSLIKEQRRTLVDRLQSKHTETKPTDPKTDKPQSKFSEVEGLLPYLALNLDFKVAEKAIKCLTKLMIYSRLPMRIALIDQMVYFIKELMLESTDDFQVTQFTQMLLAIVRVWHQSEKTKVSTKHPLTAGSRLLDLPILDLNGQDGSHLPQTEIHQHMHIFDYLDMISLTAICNKNSFLRSIGCLLLTETGKLKRLLVRKDKHKHSMSDLCYFHRDSLQDNIIQKLSLLYGSGNEGQAIVALKQQLNQSFFTQVLVDNFEYSKYGLWESIVRDMQTLYIGDLTRLWKDNLLSHSKHGGLILNYLQVISSRSLQLFTNQRDQKSAKFEASSIRKDSVGFNMLLAAVLNNMSKSHGNQISTDRIDDPKPFLSFIETGLGVTHKVALGQFYPARIPTSCAILTFLYSLETQQVDQKSYEALIDVFRLRFMESLTKNEKDGKINQGQMQQAHNCVVFFSLLALNANDSFLAYIYDQIGTQASQGKEIKSNHLQELSRLLVRTLDVIAFENDSEGKRKTAVKICLAHAICIAVKRIRDFCEQVDRMDVFDASIYLPTEFQIQLLRETRAQFNSIAKSPDMEWLVPKIKQIWYCLLTFESVFASQGSLQLDLKFLIQLEQEGFADALKYFTHFNENMSKSSQVNEQSRANEIKLLIQHVYAFYSTTLTQPTLSTHLQSNANLVKKVLPDSLLILAQREASQDETQMSLNQYLQHNQSQVTRETQKLHQKNVFFKCFIDHVVDVEAILSELEQLKPGQKVYFDQVYLPIVNSVFRNSKLSLPQKIKKFTQSNMHSKYFLMSLVISLNTVDRHFIEKAKILAISLLPLMFTDDTDKLSYRQIVEERITQNASQIKQLVNFENKAFYQFIKKAFIDEELFNMQFNFEKYFSISGFLRDILNEIIKLQNEPSESTTDKDKAALPPKMMLKVLDIITYFFSGHLDLRRAPHAHNPVLEPKQREYAQVPASQKVSDSFIFANLIDYKSFEFLSKLYKVSEKLVDHDQEMVVMNMWFKICENRPHNFEILAKFLVHNLSSFIMKLKTSGSTGGSQGGNHKANDADLQSQKFKNSSGTNSDSLTSQQEIAYGIEYEKQKRYSLSIFNYIKSRTQQVDVRNSLNLTSVSWSQRMIKLVVHAQLNLQSKYALEKLKLKKVLVQLHTEINHSEIRSLIAENNAQIEGQLNQLLQLGSDTENPDLKQSVALDKLLQSQTFMSTFGVKQQKNSSTVKQMLFILSRQMNEHFLECTPDNQVMQLPDLIIKYIENSLILIANEAERLQIIKFTTKDELTITILVLLLIADLASQNTNNDVNRCYFIFDLLNKLALSVSGVQKYLKLQTMSIEQFTSLASEEDLMAVFSCRNIAEVFPVFTTIFFRVLNNVVSMTAVHRFALKFWSLTLQKVLNLTTKTGQEKAKPHRLVNMAELDAERPLFTRKQTIEMLQGCFSSLQFVSLRAVKADPSSPVASLKLLRNTLQNFNKQIKCLFEYVQAPNTKTFVLREMADNNLFDPDTAFPINVVFWVAYLCLEAAAVVQSKSKLDDMLLDEAENQKTFKTQLMQLQEYSIAAMRRLFEESEFFKMLMSLQNLSQDFYNYSITLRQRVSALLPLVFIAFENPKCTSEAFQILIVSIRIQDHGLLTTGVKSEDLAKDEMHRLLLLLPFFNQQMLGEPTQVGLRQSSTMFSSPRAIVQLLKKSMLSIAIDKKKDVENVLEEILQVAETNDEKAINDQFAKLVNATVESCIAQNFHNVALECVRCFKNLATSIEDGKTQLNIEPEVLQTAITEIQRVLEQHDIQDEIPQIFCHSKDLFSIGPSSPPFILGEQPVNVHEELRTLYFGLKNIILLEIRRSQQNFQVSDMKQFFGFQFSTPIQAATNSDNLQRPGSVHKMLEMVSKFQTGIEVSSPSLAKKPSFKVSRISSAQVPQQTLTDPSQMVRMISDPIIKKKDEFRTGTQKSIIEKDESSPVDQLIEDKQELSLEPTRGAAQTFSDTVNREMQFVQQNTYGQFHPKQMQTSALASDDQSEETHEAQDGLIGTFAKPQKQPSPKSQQKPAQTHFATVKLRNYSPQAKLQGEVPAPKMGGLIDVSISSIHHHGDDQKRTGKEFMTGFELEPDQSFTFTEQGDEKFRKTDFAGKFEQRAKTPLAQSDQVRTNELNEREVMVGKSYQVQSEIRKKRKFANHENMPTPKKSSELDSVLIELINDQERFFMLEEFLSEDKQYDMDNLAFYVKVMEFKKESSISNTALAAGLIIDNYLDEEADYYIGNSIDDASAVPRLIQNYEIAVLNQQPIPKDLFDEITQEVRDELMPYLREFNKMK